LLGAGLAAVLVVGVTMQIARSIVHTTGRPTAPVVSQGPGPLPAPPQRGTAPHHGLPDGQLPPIVPPDLKVDDKARQAHTTHTADTSSGSVRLVALADPPKATNLTLLPGLVMGDISLQLYFDAPATGWTQGTVSLSTEADPATVLHTANFTPTGLQSCVVPAQYCWTLHNGDGWGIEAGRRYVTKVTLTTAEGQSTDSAMSGAAGARSLPVPPAVPAEQLRGGGTNTAGRTGAQPVLRGAGVNAATGAFTQSAVDLRMASAYSVNVTVTRTYSSADPSVGLLGAGWRLGYEASIASKPDGSIVYLAEDGSATAYTRKDDGTYAAPPGIRSTIRARTGGGWELTTPDQQRSTFDSTGRLLSITNTRGKGVSLAYNANGRLASITDAGGRTVTVTTVDPGRISKVQLPDGRSVSYNYTNDHLTKIVDPDGATTGYGYDGAGRLATVTDALGHKQLTNVYDATSGRVSTQTDVFGKVTMFEWDGGKQVSKVTDPDGVVIRDGFKDNVLLYSRNGNGDTAVHRYDSTLNLQVSADAMGRQVEVDHDPRGNVTSSRLHGGDPIVESATYDDANSVLSRTNGRGKVFAYTYNAFHQTVSATDAEGHTTTFSYAPDSGLLTAMTDPLGHTNSYGYDSAGNPTSETDATGARTTRTFDATGRLKSVTDPRGNVAGANPATFTSKYEVYDGRDRIRRWTDPLGHFSLWNYDNAGRLVNTTDPNGAATTYVYDDANRLTTQIDPDLRTTKYGYTPGGRLATVTDGAGNVTTRTYDTAGRLATEIAPKGRAPGVDPAQFTTTYGYDFNGNLTSATHPYPGGGTATTSYKYDAMNQRVAETDPRGSTTRYGYDFAGNRTSVTDPLEVVNRQTSYDGNNQITGDTDARAKSVTFTYDAAGRKASMTTANGAKTTYAYDAAGRLVGMTSPRGNVAGADPAAFTTRYGYDPAGNQITSTDPLGHVSTTDYDPANRMTRQVDANGHASRFTYDNADRLTRILGPDATNDTQATVNNYDHAGHLIDRTDPRGFVVRFTYDGASRLASSVDQIGNRREYTYDQNSNITSIVTGRGTSAGYQAGRDAGTIVFRYDILDRLREKVPGTGAAFSYGYDAANRLTNLADAAGEQVRGYDAAGRLTSVTRGGTSYGYGYDAAGLLTRRTMPDGTTRTLTYRDDGRPATLTTPLGQTNYGYDPDGNLERTTLPGGMTQQRGYDNADRLTRLTVAAPGGQAVTDYTVARDSVGNPTRLDTTSGGATRSDAFTYDPADRFTAICYQVTTCTGATNTLKFGYDLVGNRTTRTKTGTGAYTEQYLYNAADQLTTRYGGPDGTVTYDYDQDGNPTRSGSVRTTYGLDNKVTSVDDGTRKTVYTEDAAGNRLYADTTPDAGGATSRTTYQWDVNNPVPMLTSEQSGGQTRSYTYHPGGVPLAQQVGDVTSLLHQDPFGNTTTLTDPAGTVQRRYVITDPFGVLTPTTPTGTDTRLTFQGQYSDPLSGAFNLRARQYRADTGRFDGVDPLGNANQQSAVSTYVYADDNPLTGSDPSGRWWIPIPCFTKEMCEAAKEPKATRNGSDRNPDGRDGRRLRNDEIFRRPEGGSGSSHFDNDWAGRAILERYLRGGDDWIIVDDEAWSKYMMDNQTLREKLTGPAQEQAQKALRNYFAGAPATGSFSLQFPMEIENGEGIVGYQYLHGTNAEVGDFQFYGDTHVFSFMDGTYDVRIYGQYTWNDVIDPNPQYSTDRWKSRLAEILTFGQADPYIIRITWHAETNVYLDKDVNVTAMSGYPAP
jgi:RHS repeat-associated protein